MFRKGRDHTLIPALALGKATSISLASAPPHANGGMGTHSVSAPHGGAGVETTPPGPTDPPPAAGEPTKGWCYAITFFFVISWPR